MMSCDNCVWYEIECELHGNGYPIACDRWRAKRVPCSRCGRDVVHGARSTLICMDCLVKLLAENGAIDLYDKDKVRWTT